MPLYGSLLAALSLCQVLAAEGFECKQKWINDIFYQDKKCAGVLVEFTNFGKGFAVSCGIGVNLVHAPEDATYLQGISRADLLSKLTEKIVHNFKLPQSEQQRLIQEEVKF